MICEFEFSDRSKPYLVGPKLIDGNFNYQIVLFGWESLILFNLDASFANLCSTSAGHHVRSWSWGSRRAFIAICLRERMLAWIEDSRAGRLIHHLCLLSDYGSDDTGGNEFIAVFGQMENPTHPKLLIS